MSKFISEKTKSNSTALKVLMVKKLCMWLPILLSLSIFDMYNCWLQLIVHFEIKSANKNEIGTFYSTKLRSLGTKGLNHSFKLGVEKRGDKLLANF